VRLRRYAGVAAAYGAFFTLFFSPVLFGGHYLTDRGDGLTLALPAYLAPHGLWEPGIMLGYPWSSNLNSFWYPLFQLRFIPGSFNFYMVAAYVIAAVGAYGLVQALTESFAAGCVAGFAYGLGGFMIGHLGHFDVVHVAAWAPFVLWSLVHVCRHPTGRWIAIGAASTALCATAGQPQIFVYTMFVALAYALTFPRTVIASFGALALGVCLAGIALAPGAQLALGSFRASIAYRDFASFAEIPSQIPARVFFPYAPALGSFTELTAYAGLITLILAAVALIVANRNRDVRFFAAVAAAGLILSAGDGFRVAALTYHVPVFNLFRAQGRNVFEFVLAVAVLAGFGVSAVERHRVRLRDVGLAAGTIGLAIAATLAAIARSGAALEGTSLAVPLAVFVCGTLLVFAWARTPSKMLSAIVVAFVAVDMSSFAWFSYWRTGAAGPADVQPPAFVEPLRRELARSNQRLFSVAGAVPGAGIPPNLSLLWGIPEAGGYVQFLLTNPGIFLQIFPTGVIVSQAVLDSDRDRTLDLAAVRFVVAPPDRALTFASNPWHWRYLRSTVAGQIFENVHAAPRVWLVHRVVPTPPDPALEAIRHGTTDIRSTVMLQGEESLSTRAGPSERATVRELSFDRMIVDVECATRCFLTTSDTYYGGWRAAIDGTATRLYLADYALRGVFVPAGEHRVVFEYRPWIVALGAAMTLLAALVLAAILLRERAR
jgi:hypothetical protein